MPTYYQRIDSHIPIGTSGYLTEEVAYFCGLLMADEKKRMGDSLLWLAPVRHNPTYVQNVEVDSHISNVWKIAKAIHCEDKILTLNILKTRYGINPSPGKKGFAAVFAGDDTNTDIGNFVDDIRSPLIESSANVLKSFLIGAYDGRSSYDTSYGFQSLDYQHAKVGMLIQESLSRLRISTNINDSPQGRERAVPTQKSRKYQIRIKNVAEFMDRIGLISDARIRLIMSGLNGSGIRGLEVVVTNDPLPGVKVLR